MRCYCCDYSPGNKSLYRISGTKPSVAYRGDRWVCSECEFIPDPVEIVDQTLTEDDIENAAEKPPIEKSSSGLAR